MASTLNAALVAVCALSFWTYLGAALARRILPGTLVLPASPVVGWAVHSAVALPLFRLVGLSQAGVLAVAVLALAAGFWALRRPAPGGGDDGLRVPGWAYAVAALLALAVATALLPKTVDGGVILAGPIFDHSKVAMIDEMARSGVPAGNPFFSEGGAASRLVYYYLWHFSAAELAVVLGVTGWEADIGLTWFTAFGSLALMMGLAVRFGARRSAALWVIPLALAASLRPVMAWLWSADALDAVLQPGDGLAGWLFQASWVPQHMMSACCAVLAAVLISRLADQDGTLRLVALALLAAAGFESSTWVGGVTFALAALLIGIVLLVLAAPAQRVVLLLRLAIAALLTACVAAPFLHDQLAVAATRGTGSPIALTPYVVLSDDIPNRLHRMFDPPAFWLVLLVIELPAIYLTGAIAWVLALRDLDAARRRDALALGLLAAVGLVVSSLLASTLGGNNDLGWRAVLPAILVLTACAAAGLSRWVAARTWFAVAAAVLAIALGLPKSIEIIRSNVSGHPVPDARAFAEAPDLWAAVRRYAAADERVGNNPGFLADVTPWPINISWALLADRRSCYAGREFALVFTPLPATQRDAADAQFGRVFGGAGSDDDVRDLAMRFGCRVIVLTPADGAWQRDPFAASPLYRLVETRPDRWRIYRAAASDGDTRRR